MRRGTTWVRWLPGFVPLFVALALGVVGQLHLERRRLGLYAEALVHEGGFRAACARRERVGACRFREHPRPGLVQGGSGSESWRAGYDRRGVWIWFSGRELVGLPAPKRVETWPFWVALLVLWVGSLWFVWWRERLLRLELRRWARVVPELTAGAAPHDPTARIIAELWRELQASEASLREAERMAQLGLFAGGIAHEFGNPLSAARQYLEVLAGRLGADETTLVAALRRELDRLHRATEGLLRLARPERLERRLLSVGELLEPLLEARCGLEVEVRGPQEPRVAVDPLACERVLDNLLRNAVEAAGDTGRVWIEVRPAEHEVGICICDTGPGFPEELLDATAPLVSGRPDGTGLGLALAHRLLSQMGGRLSWGRTGNHTEVCAWLPRAEPEAAAAAPIP